MKHEELYNKIINRFDWWEIEEEEKTDLHRALKMKDKEYLSNVLTWFKNELYNTEERDEKFEIIRDEKDLEIIEELENILGLEIIKGLV